MTEPAVSIVMPAYDEAAVIGFAIDSVLAQTLADWELILVDDASTDETAALMHGYASQDPRIRVVHNERNSRRGPIEWEPRNDGLKIARGELIAYLDADNTWRPQFLARLADVFATHAGAQLAYCDSCNHYSAEEAAMVVARDARSLIAHGPTWTVFSNGELDVAQLGFDQYIDTNEMMHRAGALAALDTLWRTRHPRRDAINAYQAKRCPERRHNDVDLAERIIAAFGPHGAVHVAEVHVDFYYPSAERPKRLGTNGTARAAAPAALHPQTAIALADLNVAHFYGDHLRAPAGHGGPVVGYDFGLGEIHGIDGVDIAEIYRSFAARGGFGDLIAHYGGAARVAAVYGAIAAYYGRAFGATVFTERSVVPFDGCHNALENALAACTGTPGWGRRRETVLFPAPGYPYWAVAAAARRDAMPLEAYDADTYVARLEAFPHDRAGAVVVHHPGNPLGYTFGREHFRRLGELAERRGWAVIVDATYHAFVAGETPLAALGELPPARTVVCDSASKAWGAPGLRLGFALCFDDRLAAALRAHKSGQSLLPSSLKQRFFGHLLAERGDIPQCIAAGVRERKRRARALLAAACAQDLGVALEPNETDGPFELLWVESRCRRDGVTPEQLAAGLRERAGVKTLPGSHFFPPRGSRTPSPPFLRLSFGAVRDVEAGIAALVAALATRDLCARAAPARER